MNLQAKTVRMRLVEEQDAEFILSLRLDTELNRYLSSVQPSVKDQVEWIKKYKADEQNGLQYYFIIERLDGVRCGTVRVYDILDDSFCWGSWILNKEKTRFAALESAFLVYQFGFQNLGFEKSHFEVVKGNDRVVSFHKKMGAVQVSEDDTNYYFEISRSVVEAKKLSLGDKV
ncbi:GNAT family N-acetyltransferase [Pseudomonas donghuensis]|uniref:GNAT family N-acetyltransferase n=1 Tax=Pseudomonas donghuensis TaxID=1163398 RepID=UPI00029B1A16|nr:GNAT family N-acetyltransferase [Pseudomonas donghuensis]